MYWHGFQKVYSSCLGARVGVVKTEHSAATDMHPIAGLDGSLSQHACEQSEWSSPIHQNS